LRYLHSRLIDIRSPNSPRNLGYTPELDGGEPSGVVRLLKPLAGMLVPAEERMARGEIMFLGLIDNRAHFCPRLSTVESPLETLLSPGKRLKSACIRSSTKCSAEALPTLADYHGSSMRGLFSKKQSVSTPVPLLGSQALTLEEIRGRRIPLAHSCWLSDGCCTTSSAVGQRATLRLATGAVVEPACRLTMRAGDALPTLVEARVPGPSVKAEVAQHPPLVEPGDND